MPDTLAERLAAFRPQYPLRGSSARGRERGPAAAARHSGVRNRGDRASPRLPIAPQGRREVSGFAFGGADRRRSRRRRTGRRFPTASISAISIATTPIFRSSRRTPATTGPPSWPPARLAAADGKAWITAAAVAYEVQCRLCDAASIRARGWDHTTYGSISSTLAAAKLLGLSHEQTVHALGIAGTTGTALRLTRAGELSMWKGCAFAHAARNGVFAALLAAEGLTGPAPLFEGEMGFFQQVSGPFTLAKLGGPNAGRLDAHEDVDQIRAGRVSQPVRDRRGLRAPSSDRRSRSDSQHRDCHVPDGRRDHWKRPGEMASQNPRDRRP